MNELRQLQIKEVDMLRDTVAFFDRHGIRYFAMSGTLLGAIRHKGFIPWDDDIDLAMPRKDYNHFLSIATANGIKLKHYTSDQSYPQYFAKIQSDKIKVIIKNTTTGTEEEASSWISVFPFDGMPKQALRRKIFRYRILFRRMLYVMARFDELANLKKKGRSAVEKILIFLTQNLHLQKLLSKEKTFRKIDRLLQKYPYDEADYVVDAMGAYKFKEMFPRNWFGNGKKYEFENLRITGPDNYDDMLTQLYGDYMTPVNEDERGGHDMVRIEFTE